MDNDKKIIDNAYNELSIIITQQQTLQQKVGILMAINVGIFSIFLTSSFAFSFPAWANILLALFTLFPIALNFTILMPDLEPSKNSKYFIDFKDMDPKEIKDYLLKNQDNVFEQIKINSNILKVKYKDFYLSLGVTFFGIPFIAKWLEKKWRKRKDK